MIPREIAIPAEILRALEARDARRLAAIYSDTATYLRRLADQREARERRRRDFAADLRRWEAGLFDNRTPFDTKLAYLEKIARRDQKAARRARDRFIVYLAERGWTNAEIGRRIGLSAPSVGRIVRAVFSSDARARERP